MIRLRTNQNSPIKEAVTPMAAFRASAAAGGGGDGFDRMRSPPNIVLSAEEDRTSKGDIIYGAQAIADYIFANEPNRKRTRRRVYNLAAFYKARGEGAGFFKLKGALCLSKKQWRRFHGLS